MVAAAVQDEMPGDGEEDDLMYQAGLKGWDGGDRAIGFGVLVRAMG